MGLIILKMAWLNLLRARKRTLFTLSSIAIGVFGSLAFYGYMEHTNWGLSESFARSGNGHIQIAREAWFASNTPERERVDRTVLRKLSERIAADDQLRTMISGTSIKLEVSGVIGNGNESSIFVGQGVQPEGFLQLASWSPITAGEPLLSEEPYGVILGTTLAEKLKVKVGDFCSLLLSTESGKVNAIDVTVLGLTRERARSIDAIHLLLPLDTALETWQAQKVDYLAIALTNTEDTDRAMARIRALLQPEDSLVVKGWPSVAEFYQGVKSINDRLFAVFLAILLLVSVLAVSNTLQMSIADRFQEIGIMRAMGIGKDFIYRLLLCEGLLLGLLGYLSGLGAALLTSWLIEQFGGIPMPPAPGTTQGYKLYLLIQLPGILLIGGISMLSILAAIFWPVRQASRYNIRTLLTQTLMVNLAVACLGCTSVAEAATSDARANDLVKKVNATFPYPKNADFVSVVSFVNYQDDRKQDDTVDYKSLVSGHQKIAVAVSDPEGRRLVVLGTPKGVWLQKQGARAPLRISPAQRLIGEASIGDVLDVRLGETDYGVDASREVPKSESAEYKHWIKLKPLTEEAAYGSIELFITDESGRLHRADYYSLSGKKLKSATFTYDKNHQVSEMNIVNALQTSKHTVVIFKGSKAVPPADPLTFSEKKILHSASKILAIEVARNVP